VTALAFEYFARERVEFGVFEVGLGGRLDATNILTPVVSVITQIDFDHESFLGHSLREIASEKAGILKPRVTAVIAKQRDEARQVVLSRAKEVGSPLIEASEVYRIEDESMENGCVRARVTQIGSGDSFEIAPQLPGRFQLQNALNAVAAAQCLDERGFRIPHAAITQGIAEAVWPGRLEKLQTAPDVYLDGAHNPSAARELATFLQENFDGRKIWLIYGALRDKAVDEVAGLLFPRAAEVILTEARTSRAISAAQLEEVIGYHAASCRVIAKAEDALEYVLTRAAAQDAVFVTGSLYLVGQLRQYWKQRTQVAPR